MVEASIIISTYNRVDMLGQALRSALGQRGVDHEVIVVDNGSTGATGALLSQWDDSRLRVIRIEKSLGGTGGRNTGLATARGRHLTILDDDDVWHPDKVARQLAALRASGREWAFCGCVYIDDRRRVIGGVRPPSAEEVGRDLAFRFVVPGGMSNVLWRREALDGDGLLDPELFFTVDWDLALRLLRRSLPAVVDEPLVAYRQHGSNASRGARGFQHELDQLEEKHEHLRHGGPIHRGMQYRFLGSQALRGGERREAAAAYWEAIRLGDWGSSLRALGVLLPVRLQPLVRRMMLSDRRWMAQAESWLAA